MAVALVILLLRQRQSRPQEQLVGAEEAPGAVAPQILLPVLLGNGDDLPRAFAVHRPQLGKALTVLGDAYRHQRAAGKLPVRQVTQRAAQSVAVVPAGAHHDLAVHDDARLAEAPDVFQRPLRSLVAQQRTVELRLRGVDGHVDGADVQVDDPLCLPLREVGQGGVVAQQEAEPLVVVLDVQGRPHIGRHLIHEAEQAVVGALVHLIH